jgi:hypothetical protein
VFDETQKAVREALAKLTAVMDTTVGLPADAHAVILQAEASLKSVDTALAAMTDLAIDADAILATVPDHLKATVKAILGLADHMTRVGSRASVAMQELTALVHGIREEGLRITFPKEGSS